MDQPSTHQIERALRDLGNTSEDVANRLIGMGHRGLPCKSNLCPVAVYLQRKFPGWYFELSASEGVCDFEPFEIPESVKKFILHFDAGDYPALKAREQGELEFLDAFQRTLIQEDEI